MFPKGSEMFNFSLNNDWICLPKSPTKTISFIAIELITGDNEPIHKSFSFSKSKAINVTGTIHEFSDSEFSITIFC